MEIFYCSINSSGMDRADRLSQLEEIVSTFSSNPHLELESSIGKLSEGGVFTTGVSFDYFKALHEALTAQTNWKEQLQRSVFATFYYPGCIRTRHRSNQKPEACQKKTLRVLDLYCSQRSYAVRFALREELPVEYNPTVGPTYVRLHERWSCVHKSSCGAQWTYDLSKVVEGVNKVEACQSEPTFELELELDRESIVGLDSELVARHLISKSLDLLGRYNSRGQREILTLCSPVL